MTDLADMTVTTAELRDLLGVRDAAISDMQRRGVIKKLARNRWPLVATIRAAAAHYREQAAGRRGEDGLDLVEERAKLARAQTEAQALKNAVARGEFLAADDVMETWSAMVTRSRARLLAMPSKLAPVLLGVASPAEIQRVIEGEVHEALDELADSKTG